MPPVFGLGLLLTLSAALPLLAAEPFHRARFIFPLEHWHNHSSSVVELPDGDLLVCWYNGSGERKADDVKIEAARLRRGSEEWGPRFLLADTPGFPDANPILYTPPGGKLWLIWPVIIANEWHTALLNFRVAARMPDGAREPVWERAENILLKPVNFEERVREALSPVLEREESPERAAYLREIMNRAGDKYFRRMGWMPRNHPITLPSGRTLVPLYSDGFDFSLVAITDDGGKTWTTSEPLIGAGAVQPSIVRRADGTLVAYMRDNGPPPKRVLVSVSQDDGSTWTGAVDSDLPNSGASLEVIALQNGLWAMVYNDTDRGRHSLVAALSDDEGRTWKWKRKLEFDGRGEDAASYHYPSLIQARDGSLHLTYSYFLNHLPEDTPRKAIKHAHFNAEWVKEKN